ncbi:MAG: type I-E CRISPR-associated protein Cas5/CasD [Chlamydiota bacterium]
MSTTYILMWLEAPLQSWGYDSKFDRRDTLKFPTKSGILGLLCCALGAGGEQRELLSIFSTLSQTVFSFIRLKGEREPMLSDFHMVGSSYNEKDPWENLHIPKTVKGKKANKGGTKITYRNYLQDAAFAVLLEVPVAMSINLAAALQNPVWDLYLGRKNCAPTDFIYRGIFSSESEARTYAMEIAIEKSLKLEFQVLNGEHKGDVMILNDVPLQFGEHKKYRDRRVTIVYFHDSTFS